MIKFSLLAVSGAFAFILTDPSYKLANPEKTKVNIAAGACRANSMSDDELREAISRVINQYWNTVSESRLRLVLGDEVSTPIAAHAADGEILVGCQPLGMGGASGVTIPNPSNNGSRVIINGTTFVPGGYYPDALVGVLTHEIGHALGLHHSGDPASVMTYEAHEWGPAAGALSQDDKNGIIYLYPRKAVAGILGGCTADASVRHAPRPWAWPSALFELLLLLGAGHLAAATVRRLKRG